jgi:hypothetical protein
MNTDTEYTFQITGWDEKTYQEIEGSAKLSHAKITQSYSGGIDGSSSVDYLMSYTIHGTATFVGLERISGAVEGKSGSFVIQHTGFFSEGKAHSSWVIVPGSGTGELASLCGKGSFVAGHCEPAQASFAYSFELDA